MKRREMNYECFVWDLKHRLLSSVEKANKLLDYELQTEFED